MITMAIYLYQELKLTQLMIMYGILIILDNVVSLLDTNSRLLL